MKSRQWEIDYRTKPNYAIQNNIAAAIELLVKEMGGEILESKGWNGKMSKKLATFCGYTNFREGSIVFTGKRDIAIELEDMIKKNKNILSYRLLPLSLYNKRRLYHVEP